MATTPDITAGIKAIKIAKEDALSNDISVQLQEAKVLRIAFDDIGIQQFDIISIAEYSTYYLYYVKPQNIGNLLSTFNLPIDSSTGGSGGSGFVDTAGNMLVSAYPQYTGFIRTVANSNKSVLSYNSGTGIFQTPAQKQPYAIKASFTASIFSSNNNAGTLRFYVSSSAGGGIETPAINIPTPANISGSSNAITISGSLPLFKADSLSVEDFGFRFINYYGSNTFYMPTSSMQFTIESYVTSSTDTNGVTTVLEPYTSEDVANSDYNVIMNNAVEARFNAFYMDVDYSSNAIVAVNQQAILDGSATRAQVQYSNYTTARITNPRYNGSRNTSPNFNESYSTSSVTQEGTFNNVPAVEIDGTYFAYFDWVGGTTAELIDKAGYHIKYLIDSKANVYTPSLTSSYYYNLIDSFNANENNVNVVFRDIPVGNNVDNLVGVHPVIKAGAQPRAIIFSQTGSDSGQYLTTMSFSNTVVSANCEINVAVEAGGLSLPGMIDTLGITTPVVSGSTYTTASLTGEYIKIQSSSADVQIIPALHVNYNYTEFDFNNPGTIDFYIEKSTNNGSTWSVYHTRSYQMQPGQSYSRTFTAPPDSTVSGSLYRVRYSYNDTGIPGNPIVDFTSGGSFYFSQNPPFNPSVTSSFWTTGSGSPNVLTGSQFNTNIYGVTRQSTVSGSGYDSPYLEFDLQIGDEIRFSANENQVYQIIDIVPPTSTTTALYLTLDKPIITGTNLQSFLIRRLNPNPNFVIVDAIKDSNTGGGSGFLMPEYASNEITIKFDEIIKTLTEKGLI